MKKKAGENMSEREKEIMEEIKMALPYMSDFDKGYMLCLAEKSKGKVPATVAMDEAAFREWLGMEKVDSQVVHDKSEDSFDIQDSR